MKGGSPCKQTSFIQVLFPHQPDEENEELCSQWHFGIEILVSPKTLVHPPIEDANYLLSLKIVCVCGFGLQKLNDVLQA